MAIRQEPRSYGEERAVLPGGRESVRYKLPALGVNIRLSHIAVNSVSNEMILTRSESVIAQRVRTTMAYRAGGRTLDTSISRYAAALGSPSRGAHGAKSLSVAGKYGPGFTSKQTTWPVSTAMVCQMPG